MAITFLGLSVLYSLATRLPIEKGRYRLRRCFEEWIRWPLWFGLFFGVLGSLPAAERWLEGYVKEAGAASLLLGVVGGLWSFARSGSKGNGKIPSRCPRTARLDPVFLWIGAGVVWASPVLL